MPKVKAGYFENKKNSILDAAEKICMEKPLYKLTMKDITDETGLSPGAVYSSFSDVDEVIIALINRLSGTVDFMSTTDRIVQSEIKPEEKLTALFEYFLELIYSSVASYGKISHELNTVITDAARRQKIVEGVHEIQMFGYVLNAVINVIEENITKGYFKPKLSKESIYALLFAFVDGLVRDLIFVKCYKYESVPQSVTFEEKDLPKALADSIIFLLNHEKQTENQTEAL